MATPSEKGPRAVGGAGIDHPGTRRNSARTGLPDENRGRNSPVHLSPQDVIRVTQKGTVAQQGLKDCFTPKTLGEPAGAATALESKAPDGGVLAPGPTEDGPRNAATVGCTNAPHTKSDEDPGKWYSRFELVAF